MPNWQERITHETPLAIQLEHELRYRLAAPLIRTSEVWVDLGCGTGIAAARALEGQVPRSVALVDATPDAVSTAAEELAIRDANQMIEDLTDPEALARIADVLLSFSDPRTVTCFEVVEHLTDFVPLIEWSGELARQGSASFVMSVPNDAFWSIQNPYHATSWGEGAFDELVRLLPEERTLLRQVQLEGSALVSWDESPLRHELSVGVGGAHTVATHFIAAYGPRHDEVRFSALAAQTNLIERRRWERERDSRLSIAEARVAQLDGQLTAQREYLHGLEQELGRPPSGT